MRDREHGERAALRESLKDARADGHAERARLAVQGLRAVEEQIGMTEDALAEAERRLREAAARFNAEQRRTTDERARATSDEAVRVVPEARDASLAKVRELVPIIEGATLAIAAAVAAEQESDHAHGRRPRHIPRVLDRLGAEMPGALQVLRAVEVLLSGEAFVLVPAQQISASGLPIERRETYLNINDQVQRLRAQQRPPQRRT